MNIFKVGKVTHYYEKTGVALIELSGALGLGEKIRFTRGGEEMFDQVVDNIKMDYKNVDSAKAGNLIGFKPLEKVKEGTDVYKLT